MSQDGLASATELGCHATCLILGEDGILIRGPAGSGKSSLCLELLDHADMAGQHARLVADDRVRLSLRHGRIVARPHPAVVGMIELRGLGIRRVVHVAQAAVIRLVVDLIAECPRLPGMRPSLRRFSVFACRDCRLNPVSLAHT